MSPMTRIFW